MACERQRNKRLTIGSLAEHGRVLRGDADRMFAFLGQARIIDCPSSEYLRQKAAGFSGGRGSSDG